jgi:hypothetical protein
LKPLENPEVDDGERPVRPGSEGADFDDPSSPEFQLNALAGKMVEVIAKSDPTDRPALHDYALSLVRDAFPIADDIAGAEDRASNRHALASAKDRPGSAVTLVGYGMLFLPVGGLLGIVFPPLGVFLVCIGLVMVVAGLIAAFVTRVRGRGGQVVQRSAA